MKKMQKVLMSGVLSLGLFSYVGNADAETKDPIVEFYPDEYFIEEYVITEIDKDGNVYGDALKDDMGIFYTPYKLNVRVGDFVKGVYDAVSMELITVERIEQPTDIKMISEDYIITHIDKNTGEIYADSLDSDEGLYLIDNYRYPKGLKVGDYVRGYFDSKDMEYIKTDKLIETSEGKLVPVEWYKRQLLEKLFKKKVNN